MRVLLIFGLLIVTCSCSVVKYRSGGSAQKYVKDRVIYSDYDNPSISLYSINYHGMDIGTSLKEVKKSGLPRYYLKALLNNPYTQVLYSASRHSEGYYLLALLHASDMSADSLTNRTHKAIKPFVVDHSTVPFMSKEKKGVCHRYYLMKNKTTVYSISSYYLDRAPHGVINILVIEDCRVSLRRPFTPGYYLDQLMLTKKDNVEN